MRRSGGFTVIETMLFLAITGVLVAGMISGVGVSVNIQRYRDAVESFKSFVQNQYAELASVENDRDNTWSCDGNAVTRDDSNARVRGQTNCELLGRYVTIVDDTATAYTVVGHEKAGASDDLNDIELLKSGYTLNVSTVQTDTYTMEWGSRIAWPNKGDQARTPTTPRSLALAFLRSPSSGQVYTFTSDTVPQTVNSQVLADMVVAGDTLPGQGGRTICIDTNGAFVNSDYSVYITPFASGPTAVESRSNDFNVAAGDDTRC